MEPTAATLTLIYLGCFGIGLYALNFILKGLISYAVACYFNTKIVYKSQMKKILKADKDTNEK